MRALFCLLLMTAALASCASRKEKQEIKQEVAQTRTLRNEADLYNLENNILTQNSNLNPEQKIRLRELIQKNHRETAAIQSEIDKTKAVLFKELLSNESSKSKIRILESQLLRLNRKKTRSALSSYREAKNIVGKNEVPLEKTLNMLDNRTIHEF